MKPFSIAISLLALAAPAAPSLAGEVLLHNRAVTCVATAPNVVRMWVEGVGFVLAPDHSSAHARIHLELSDSSEVAYAVSGQANRIDKDLEPNSGGRSIAYGGIECTLFHRNIVSVRDCHGTSDRRTCEVGLEFHGERHAYLVSVSIKPISAAAAARASRRAE
jgi:hypothetical protein